MKANNLLSELKGEKFTPLADCALNNRAKLCCFLASFVFRMSQVAIRQITRKRGYYHQTNMAYRDFVCIN